MENIKNLRADSLNQERSKWFGSGSAQCCNQYKTEADENGEIVIQINQTLCSKPELFHECHPLSLASLKIETKTKLGLLPNWGGMGCPKVV